MRIAGITIQDGKQLQYGLTAIYGIGLARARAVLADLKIEPTKKTKDATEAEEKKIRGAIEAFMLGEELKRDRAQNIKRLKDIQSYRGSRHMRGLPVRGQRTKTNSRTVRGNKRVTMGSGRRKVEKT